MKFFLLGLLMAANISFAKDAYKYRLWVKDASYLKEASDKNEWMQKFHDDVLYQGLMIRSAPAIFSMGEENENAWKGRLIDFLFDNVLKGKSMSLTYYAGAGYSTPMGMTLYDISETEKTVLKLLLDTFGSPLPGTNKIKLDLRNNTTALVFHENCISISRDATITGFLGEEDCNSFKPKGDAFIRVTTDQMFSSFSPLLENFVGVKGNLDLSFNWDSSKRSFSPSEAEIAANAQNLFRNSVVTQELFKALPSKAGLWGMINVADMRPLNKENLKKYFMTKGVIKSDKSVPVIFAFFGMDSSGYSKSVLLLPYKSTSKPEEIAEVFSETGKYEVKFQFVCQDVLALSPSQEAIDDIKATCAKTTPGFAQYSDNYVKALQNKSAAAVFVNAGVLTSQMLEKGSSSDIRATDEYKKSFQVLSELPHFFWAGSTSASKLVLKGIKP